MQRPEARDEVTHRSQDDPELTRPRVRSLEQDAVFGGGGGRLCWRRRDCPRFRHLAILQSPKTSQFFASLVSFRLRQGFGGPP